MQSLHMSACIYRCAAEGTLLVVQDQVEGGGRVGWGRRYDESE